MTQPAQQKFTQPKYGVTFPEGEKPRVSLYSRDSLTLACQGNERMASVLDYFLFEGSWEIGRQGLPEGCKVVEFTRKHEDILKRLTFNLSRKSLIGYLDTFNEWKFVESEKYHNHYKVDFNAVQAAINNPPAPKERKSRTRKGCKVEAITNDDNASTLAQKVEELQLKVEELQHYVEELQPLGCKYSTLQRDFAALVERLDGQSSEDHNLYNYPLLSSTNKDNGAFAPVDFLPEQEEDFSEEDAAPTVHRMPAIKLNGANHNGHSTSADLQPSHDSGLDALHSDEPESGNGPLEQTTLPMDTPPEQSPPAVSSAQEAAPEPKETAKQEKARIEKRKSEIIALYCELLGRKKIVLSKNNLDGAKLLADAEATDAEITLTYKAYKEDKFWGKQLHLRNIANLLDTTVKDTSAVPAKPKVRPTLEEIDKTIFEVDKQFRVYQRRGDDQEWILWEGEFCTPQEADERGYNGGFGLYNVTQYEPLVRGVN